MKKIIKTSSYEETINAGCEFAKTLSGGDFVALYGDLGAGKTAFVSGMAKYLVPGSPVCSPTYTIVNEYEGKIPLFHFDLYRIDDDDSLYSIGFYDYLERGGVCVCEWSEKIPWAIPDNAIKVTIKKHFEDKIILDSIRTIEIEKAK